MQPKLVQLATETDDNDDGIGEILSTNDSCETVIKKYKSVVEQGHASFSSNLPFDDALVSLSSSSADHKTTSTSNNANALDELKDLFSSVPSVNLQPISSSTTKPASDLNTFYQDLLSMDSQPQTYNQFAPINNNISLNEIISPLQPEQIKPNKQQELPKPVVQAEKVKNPQLKAIDDLNELGRAMLETSLNQTPNGKLISQTNQLKTKKLNEIQPETLKQQQQQQANLLEDAKFLNAFNSLFVELESIKPAVNVQPMCLYEKNSLKTVIHFARDLHLNCVYVIVISTTSVNLNESLKNFLFQAAVPKVNQLYRCLILFLY